MADEMIDWEHTMRDTQLAARAASRGTEKLIRAIAELTDEHESLIRICRDAREETAAITGALETLGAEQSSRLLKLEDRLNRRSSPAKSPRKAWEKSPVFSFVAGLVCGAFIGNLL